MMMTVVVIVEEVVIDSIDIALQCIAGGFIGLGVGLYVTLFL